MTAVGEVEAAPNAAIASLAARPRRRRQPWSAAVLGSLGVLAAAVPMLWAAATIALQRPPVLFDGDGALEELGVMRAVHFSQYVGTYSRFGWNHPGPAWYYSLAPLYAGLGGQSWSLSAAVLVLQGVLAAALVIAVWRQAGPLLALTSSALLLLYVRALGEDVFRAVWTVYALMLPIVLLFIMSAAAAAGSTPAMLGAFIAGSFAVQTHVGTSALVLSLLATVVAVRLVTVLLRRRAGEAPGGAETQASRAASRLVTAGGTLLLALMWVPVAVEEVTGRPGNLTRLLEFFTLQHDRHSYREAFSALGRMLAVYPFGRFPPFLATDFATLPAERGLLIAAFIAGAAGLFLLGIVLRDRFAQALGLLLLVAVPVTIVSISRVIGPIFPYLLIWVTTFPMVLAVGWAMLLVRLGAAATRRRAPSRMAGAALWPVLAVAVVALAAGRLTAFQQLLPYVVMTSDPDTRPMWAMTKTALAAEPRQPILVDIAQDDRWVVGSALALQLAKQGWTVKVDDRHIFMFDGDARSTGRERLELVVMGPTGPDALRKEVPELQPIGHGQETYLFLRRPP